MTKILNFKEFEKNFIKLIEKSNVFFFYGENNFYIEEMLSLISKQLNIHRENIYLWEAEIEELSKLLITDSLFSLKSMVVLKYFNLQEKKNFKKELIHFLDTYKFSNYLFITYEDKITEKNDEVINYFFKNFVCVEFNNLTKQEIIDDFISKRTLLNLNKEAKEILYENTDGDLWLISNELKKLECFFSKDKNKIITTDSLKCLSFYENAEIKDLIVAIENKNIKIALKVLDTLFSEGILPIQIFVALCKYFRKKFLFRKFETSFIYKILKQLQITDLKLKTTNVGKFVIENCVLSLIRIYSGEVE